MKYYYIYINLEYINLFFNMLNYYSTGQFPKSLDPPSRFK